LILLADADSRIPNLALMRLATHFRALGEGVRLVRPTDRRSLFDPRHTRALGSSVFGFAAKARSAMEREWGSIEWGGTGVRVDSSLAEVDSAVDWDRVAPSYDLYPEFTASLGFLTRGCRLRCGFCVVPTKEGRPSAVASVRDVWRGDGHPKRLLLLDNDAFAPSLRSHWRDAVDEIRAGAFRVCFSQGLNLRLIDDESAAAIATLEYRDNEFRERRLYTAWDSLGDESIFRRGIATLDRHGVPAKHLLVYMLVGYDPRETWEALFYRFTEMVALGCRPYPMVYDRSARPDLAAFQRWAVRGLYRAVAWPDYAKDGREDTRIGADARAASDAAWVSVASGWKPPKRLVAA
jgi:hypothetical protein